MQSEGLEGLPGRAKDLLTLGSTFFLSFLPIGAVVAVIFGTLAFGVISLSQRDFASSTIS